MFLLKITTLLLLLDTKDGIKGILVIVSVIIASESVIVLIIELELEDV